MMLQIVIQQGDVLQALALVVKEIVGVGNADVQLRMLLLKLTDGL